MAVIVNNQMKRKTYTEEYAYRDGKMYVCNGTDFDFPGCGSLILIDKTDVFQYVKYGSDMSPEIHYGFVCPLCGKATKIDINIFPAKDKYYIDKVFADVRRLGKPFGRP